METHEDATHPDLSAFLPDAEKRDRLDMERLKERAHDMVTAGESTIAAGAPGERLLEAWDSPNGVHVRRLPDDEQGILRISAGGLFGSTELTYCVLRGDPAKCAYLLEQAVFAIKDHIQRHPREGVGKGGPGA